MEDTRARLLTSPGWTAGEPELPSRRERQDAAGGESEVRTHN